jgi:ring-1,2-phenylacetyl-CoA epoxidase subunit PaaC
MQDLWGFTDELFEMDEVDQLLIHAGIACDLGALRSEWEQMVKEVLTKALLSVPAQVGYRSKGGFIGVHSEHLGHMLSEMQYLPRAYPDAKW